MNEQQLAAVKQALEALKEVAARTGPRWALEQGYAGHLEAITALQSIISQDALDKKAENARELGLSYDDEPKIGCVNHDCDKCKAQQKPEQQIMEKAYLAGFLASADGYNGQCPFDQCGQEIESDEDWCIDRDDALRQLLEQQEQEPVAHINDNGVVHAAGYPWSDKENLRPLVFGATPPAPQLVPVKTYHDGKPWPVAPKPWVGLTDEEAQWIYDNGRTPAGMMEMVEAKLKEKNT